MQRAGLPQCNECFQHLRHLVPSWRALKLPPDLDGGDRSLSQHGTERDELRRFLQGPSPLFDGSLLHIHDEPELLRLAPFFFRCLKLRPQPADDTFGLLADSLCV